MVVFLLNKGDKLKTKNDGLCLRFFFFLSIKKKKKKRMAKN